MYYKVRCIFFLIFRKKPCKTFNHLLYSCSEDADTVLVTLVTLINLFFFYHPCTFLSFRIVVLEFSFVTVVAVMFEYCLIPGFTIAGFATFGYLCSAKSNPHSCLITRYIAKEALNNYNCLFGCAQLLH